MTTDTATQDALNATFAALADPTRRAILARLVEGEAAVTELAAPLPISLPAVSRHLKVLERAGLIERSRHAQFRPCRLAPEPLREVADWVERYRRLWEGRLDRLGDYLGELQEQPAGDPSQESERERRDGAEGEHDDSER